MKLAYTSWQDGSDFLGYRDNYPAYETQGRSLKDLQDHLADLYKDLTSGEIPNIKYNGELVTS
ncbi:MAG: hypothetical protein ACJAQT_001407 [Akkermansiaceae bacterium]|jgi:hypothetical protein